MKVKNKLAKITVVIGFALGCGTVGYAASNLLNYLPSYKTKFDTAITFGKTQKALVSGLKEQVAQNTAAQDTLKQQITNLQQQLTNKQGEVNSKQSEIEAKQQEINNKQQELNQKQQEADQLRQQLDANKSENDQLAQRMAELDNYMTQQLQELDK